jgi:hypothetical protein
MPARDRLATFTVKDADLMPAFMAGDVLLFDPTRPLNLLCRHNKLRVVLLSGDGLQACVLDGPLPQDVLAMWPVVWIVAR